MTAEQTLRWRALAADDDDLDRQLIEHVFRSSSIEVTALATGAELLECARSEPPHVILLDIRMPEMDGVEVLRQLRADPRTAGIPAIAITGDAAPDDRARYQEAGFEACVGKPYQVAELLYTVSRVLDGSRAR